MNKDNLSEDYKCEAVSCGATNSKIDYIIYKRNNGLPSSGEAFNRASSAEEVQTLLKALEWQIFPSQENVSHTQCKSSYLEKGNAIVLPKTECVRHCDCTDMYDDTLRKLGLEWFPLLFIFALLAVFGNFTVLLHSSKRLWCKSNYNSKEKNIYHCLVINLSCANFLLGLCSLTYAIEISLHAEGIDGFFIETKLCDALGFVSFVVIQVSVSILVIISAFRLYSVLSPYKPVHFRLTVALCIVLWAVWIVIASAPLINELLFSIGVRVDDATNIHFAAVNELVLNLLETNVTSQTKSVLNATKKYNSSSAVLRQAIFSFGLANSQSSQVDLIGYYNSHPFCSLDILVEHNKPAAFLTLTLVMFNLLSFAFIVIAYFVIFRKLYHGQCIEGYLEQSSCCFLKNRSHAKTVSKIRRDENQRAFLRIFLIIAVEFVCWIPMAVIAINYVDRSTFLDTCELCKKHNDTAWTAAVLIPLVLGNSTVIPYIYSTEVWINLCQKFKSKKRGSGSRKSSQRTINSISAYVADEVGYKSTNL